MNSQGCWHVIGSRRECRWVLPKPLHHPHSWIVARIVQSRDGLLTLSISFSLIESCPKCPSVAWIPLLEPVLLLAIYIPFGLLPILTVFLQHATAFHHRSGIR